MRSARTIKRKRGTMVQIDVLKATTAMLEYLTKERCTIDPQLRSSLGISVGDQFLLNVNATPSKYGLVTVHSDYEDGSDDNDIRMIASGRARFDQTDGFLANAISFSPIHNQTDCWLEENNQLGEFFSETSSYQDKFIVLAPHGGAIEAYTDELAQSVYDGLVGNDKEAGLWKCIGYQGVIGAYDAWHITSTDISANSFPYLCQFSGRSFSYALAVHGFGEDDVAIGGGASLSLKNEVKAALEAISGFPFTVSVMTSGEYAGTDSQNIVNRYSSAGVQLELPYQARTTWWQQIAGALVTLYSGKI